MDDSSQCLFISHPLGNGPEQDLAEKFKELLLERNTSGVRFSRVFNKIGVHNIVDCVIGPNQVGFLLKDGGVIRVGYETRSGPSQVDVRVSSAPVPPSSSAVQSAAAAVAASRNASAKFRRVMLSTSSFRRGDRGGVIIDRGRPVVPASAVPEELIAQAQVVLQGKSRELIVRELQRTNLNVNEAVNNLLSRDDDEDDGDDSAGEVVLPEELLSLLDPAGHGGLLEADGLYGSDGFEYLMARDIARRRSDKEKEKKAKENGGVTKPTTPKTSVELTEKIETWCEEDEKTTPEDVDRFVKIASCGSELLAVCSKGRVYAWKWKSPTGDLTPHSVASRVLADGDHVVNIAASALRVAVLTSTGKLASWLDENVCGRRVCAATEIRATTVPLPGDDVAQLFVSNHLAVVRTSSNVFYWCGLYPFTDRHKLWEKERAKSRKHVTFETGEIVEGNEVRTKASPIYTAGSVAINLAGSSPIVGVLMESVWTLTEMCRFRVMEPSAYDVDFPKIAEPTDDQKLIPAAGESRKRRASQDVFDTVPLPREEAWGVSEVVWIHEQHTQDTAVVKIVDGAYVGVEYVAASGDMTYASSLSGGLSKDSSAPQAGKMRLMRKDDLCLLTPKLKSTRSPRIFVREPTKFTLSGAGRKVLSAVADSTGIRALVERRSRVHVVRATLSGKIVSDHLLPVYPTALVGPNGQQPSLINYGDDSILLLRDGNGALLPLIRDALMGFREPLTLHQPPIKHVSLAVHPVSSSATNKNGSRRATVLAIASPSSAAGFAKLPSLMQTVLYADAEGVKNILDKLEEIGDPDLLFAELVDSRSDGGANVIHAAVRLAVAAKNKEDADPGTTHGLRLREDETRLAAEEARALDQRWQRLLRSNRGAEKKDGENIEQDAVSSLSVERPVSEILGMLGEETVPATSSPFGKPICDVKERQRGAMDTVKQIVSHSVVSPLLSKLLSHRDVGGLTPFMSAINHRAYGAAVHIWESIENLVKNKPDDLPQYIHPTGCRPDDSPLFVLCYNDTCSFTWTGEEHINQDIFECRTCGLTGSLCCCTECAFTCHRNHDCKLKRTSPTAYCDCWEKCPCKALVAGNQEKREFLLTELLKKTKLHELTNNRGEHVMLFLARTIGRQQNEQANYPKRRRNPAGTATGDTSSTPEHDLDPPKFAQFALKSCLQEWNVVKSLACVGIRGFENDQPVMEDVLHINSQSGSCHIDKFLFTLLSKCCDKYAHQLIDCLINMVNTERGPIRDPMVDKVVARYVRSVIRLYVICILLSPVAAATAIAGEAPSGSNNLDRRHVYQTIPFSGFLSIVRKDSQCGRESKSQAIAPMVLRCRTVLLRLSAYSAVELAAAADAVLVPVRLGVLRPSVPLTVVTNQDSLEVIEKFLCGESDLTTMLSRAEDVREKIFRKRKISRRDTDREEEEPRREESEDDSDSDGDAISSRRHNSQSGQEDSAAEEPSEPNRRKSGVVVMNERGDDDMETSSEDDDEEEEEEGHVMVEDDENMEDEEADDDERVEEGMYGETSEGDHDPEAAGTFEVVNESQDVEEDNYSNRSPIYSSEAFRDDEELARDGSSARTRGRNDSAGDAEEPRDTNDSENTGPEEENTRDAVHSESSSAETLPAEGTEGVEAQPTSAPDRTTRWRRRRSVIPPSGSAPTMSWTFRRAPSTRQLRSEEDWAAEHERREREREQERRERDDRNGNYSRTQRSSATTSSSQPPPPSTVAADAPRANRRNSRHEEAIPGTLLASYQMSTAFMFLIRALGEVLLQLHFEEKIENARPILKRNSHTLADIMIRILTRLEPSWGWMYTVLDRVEAQLRFGNAVMASGITDIRHRTGSLKRKESGSMKKERGEDAGCSRRDALDYLLSVLRSQSAEAGDDLPIIEIEVLRTLAFVFDAHIFYADNLDFLKTVMKTREEEDAGILENQETNLEAPIIRRFFQRSSSVCFAGAMSSDAWDTLGISSSHLPLVERPHILTPEADRDLLFAPPARAITRVEYEQISRNLGVEHVGNQSLTTVSEHPRLITQEEEVEDFDFSPAEEPIRAPEGMEPLSIEALRSEMRAAVRTPLNLAMARWKNALQLMARECHQDMLSALGGETGKSPLLSTIARFPVRQTHFKKTMDKFRTAQTKDISLEVHRDPAQLVRDTVFQLNQTYVRRVNAPRGRDLSVPDALQQPFGSGRVKVRFRDEPGEGTGVARSFYTALAESLQTLKRLPFDELGWGSGGDDYLYGGPAGTPLVVQSASSVDRGTAIRRIQLIRERGTASAIISRKRAIKRFPLSINSQPYTVDDPAEAERRVASGMPRNERPGEEPTRERPGVAEALYLRVRAIRPTACNRITGMLVDTPTNTALQMLASQETLRQYIDDAVSLMLSTGLPTDLALLTSNEETAKCAGITDKDSTIPHPSTDDAPLFARPSRRGFYAPVAGRLSPIRINTFRNVGRVIGLCLSQGELFPMRLSRHVLKYILDRPISWLDLAFFDPQLFESLRQLLVGDGDQAFFDAMQLRFVVDIPTEDPSQPTATVELKPNGENIPVTRVNVVEYVYRYVETRLLGDNIKCLQALRQGVFDVLPEGSLRGLTAEDLRLILCGTEQVCMATLQSLTTFADESHASAETLSRFKQWFWSVVDSLSMQEKQELVFFWTGAPSLPPLGEFWQPPPTVMVRPPDDAYLPTANTCISRLYVPLYSSRKVLRAKLQLAIKAKNFGFV